MAPVYDKRVDVWALGVLTYECLIGHPPFEVPDSVEETHECIKEREVSFPDDVPLGDDAKDLVLQLLQKEPEQRPTLDAILAHPFLAPQALLPAAVVPPTPRAEEEPQPIS